MRNFKKGGCHGRQGREFDPPTNAALSLIMHESNLSDQIRVWAYLMRQCAGNWYPYAIKGTDWVPAHLRSCHWSRAQLRELLLGPGPCPLCEQVIDHEDGLPPVRWHQFCLLVAFARYGDERQRAWGHGSLPRLKLLARMQYYGLGSCSVVVGGRMPLRRLASSVMRESISNAADLSVGRSTPATQTSHSPT